jgi:conjugal transfer pilin signal peptidase TrbI
MIEVNRKIAYIIAAFAVIALSLWLITSRYTIGIAHQECLPERIWLIDKAVKPSHRGEYISFKAQYIPRFKETTTLTKIIEGVPGDTIIVSPFSGTQEITLNGMKRQMKIKAEVSVVSADGSRSRFIAYETGSDGRALPFVYGYGTYTIPKGRYFVAGKHPGSYDSRYWGVIKEENIVGKAHPVL